MFSQMEVLGHNSVLYQVLLLCCFVLVLVFVFILGNVDHVMGLIHKSSILCLILDDCFNCHILLFPQKCKSHLQWCVFILVMGLE